MSSKKYNAEQTVDIYQFISDLKINLGLSNNSRIYTISISLNFDHVIIWMNAINELQVVLPQQFFKNIGYSYVKSHGAVRGKFFRDSSKIESTSIEFF